MNKEIMSEKIINDLKKAILDYDTNSAVDAAKMVIENEVNPLEAMDAMTNTIREVGDGFNKGDFFLPDLVGAASTMKAAVAILEDEIKKRKINIKTLGTVVIGTVSGDIHSIGKDMVSILMRAEGFTVCDLGIDVTAKIFIEAIKNNKADILAMSALLTTTAFEMGKVIDAIVKEGLRDKVKIIIGGGAITQEFADSINADGYDPTAPGAAKLARELLNK